VRVRLLESFKIHQEQPKHIPVVHVFTVQGLSKAQLDSYTISEHTTHDDDNSWKDEHQYQTTDDDDSYLKYLLCS